MPAKPESYRKTVSVNYNLGTNKLQHENKILVISGERKINFVLTNVTDINVVHINSNNDSNCDVVDMLEGLKMN